MCAKPKSTNLSPFKTTHVIGKPTPSLGVKEKEETEKKGIFFHVLHATIKLVSKSRA